MVIERRDGTDWTVARAGSGGDGPEPDSPDEVNGDQDPESASESLRQPNLLPAPWLAAPNEVRQDITSRNVTATQVDCSGLVTDLTGGQTMLLGLNQCPGDHDRLPVERLTAGGPRVFVWAVLPCDKPLSRVCDPPMVRHDCSYLRSE
jgi:hypothetical protein